MEDKYIFKGILQVDGTAEGFSESNLEDGYIYLVRTNAAKNRGYIYLNGKKYINDTIDAGEY